jgi:hypothetical protein
MLIDFQISKEIPRARLETRIARHGALNAAPEGRRIRLADPPPAVARAARRR